MTMRFVFAAIALAAAVPSLAACSQGAAESAASSGVAGRGGASAAVRHRESGLRVIPLTVTTAEKRIPLRVELAETAQEQSRGLMFRTQMGADEGMLFPFDAPRMASFWMHNTVLSLDIIFIGPDRRIINIAANAVPYSDDHIESAGVAAAVLELNAGRAAALGIAPGDKVDW